MGTKKLSLDNLIKQPSGIKGKISIKWKGKISLGLHQIVAVHQGISRKKAIKHRKLKMKPMLAIPDPCFSVLQSYKILFFDKVFQVSLRDARPCALTSTAL